MAELKLVAWVIYDRPLDYSEYLVARKWIITAQGSSPTAEVIRIDDLPALRDDFASQGLYRLERFEKDDPKIVEVWI